MIMYKDLYQTSNFLVDWYIFWPDLDIGILINNAAEFQHEALDEISPDNLLRASVVNCHAPALLARYFIPKMVERHQKVIIDRKIFFDILVW